MNPSPTTAGFVPTILLFKGTGLIDDAIRWQTRSQFTHAAIRIGPQSVLESYPGSGVRERMLTPAEMEQTVEFNVVGMTWDGWARALAFFRGEIGCGYDWLNVSRFLTRFRDRQSEHRWFCSEIVFAACAAGDVVVLNNVAAWRVSPRDLSLSPFLSPKSALTAAMQAARIYRPVSKKRFDEPVAT